MRSDMRWLVAVVRLAIAPVLLGALFLWIAPNASERNPAAGLGLVLLAAIHLLYWRRPWPTRPARAIAAAAAMVATNAVLVHVLGLPQPLVWLYPALVIGAGLRASVAAAGVGLLALAAVVPIDLDATAAGRALGSGHWILLSVVP